MASVPESTAQQFTSDWSKAVAWANSQGISSASYLPVYQLDLNRVQNGEYPMGVAQRNLEILAAHNPNQVTPSPADNPSPSNVLGNTVSDAGKIATGLAGIFTGSFEKQFWDSAKTTFKGIIDPASMENKVNGTGVVPSTIGNWLSNSLLAYLPGAADIGKVLSAPGGGPLGLGGDQGAKELAEHPLVSLLDLLPGSEGALEKLGAKGVLGDPGRDMAASLAARTGGKGVLGTAASRIGEISTGKAGVTMAGEAVANLSVKDVIQSMAAKIGPGGAGVGPALSDLGEAYNLAGSMAANQYNWIMEPAAKALTDLEPQQVAMVRKILDTKGATEGNSVLQAMDDPTLDPRVKEVLQLWLNGPLRFATEESLFSGQLRPIETLDGRTGMYVPNSKSAASVFLAKAVRDATHRTAITALAHLAPFADKVAKLDAMLPKATKVFTDELTAARHAVADADNEQLQGNVTQDLAAQTKRRTARGISKSAQLRAVVGEGGLADDFLKELRENKDPDQIEALARAMKQRLSRWGPKSVDADASPALAALASSTEAFVEWARQYKDNAREIDEAIHGEAEVQRGLRNQHGEYRGMQVQQLKDRQTAEADNLSETYQRKVAQNRSGYAAHIAMLNEHYTMVIERIESQGDAEAAHATRKALNEQIMPRVRRDISRIKTDTRNSLAAARAKFLNDTKIAKLEHQRDVSKMTKKHYSEMEAFKSQIKDEKAGMGDAVREVVAYGKSVNKFHQAVMDHPSDEYKDVYTMLYEKHLMAHENTAMLVGETSKFMRDRAKISESRINAIQSDPQLMAEYITARFEDIFGQPEMTPEVAQLAKATKRAVTASAKEELKQLIGNGLRVQYIPTAVSFDERLGRDSMSPLIAKGIPKPDMAKAKVWDMTPQKNDFALGINKAVVQALQRDATIDFAEHYLKPMTMSKEQLNNFIDQVFKPEERLTGGNLTHEYQSITAHDLGLTAVDTDSIFGFRLPRWGHDEVYLPTPLVHALEQLNKSRGAGWKLASGSTRLFRYSILGLSPRYTAHILFGGSMMLALRSTPYAVTMIGDAARALREGTLPEAISGHSAVEEGFEQQAISLYQKQGAKDMVNMEVNEHIERVQGIKRAAAKPVHVLKALADINFRFTRYVRDLQGAVAYLDGAAKAERRSAKIGLEDPVTGKTIEMTPDRAMKEGMHHVEEVFGNLNRMSPFERQVAQSVMPFYGWQKHILSYVMSFPFDHPWRSLVLSQMAFNSSQDTPLGYPIRIQLLYLLGSPDSQGNVNAVDIRSLDPFRDVANYATFTGFLESLNPALTAIPSIINPQFIYGSNVLYPTVTYNSFYGIETAGAQGSALSGLAQWIPQVGAAGDALSAISGIRSTWNTNRSAAIKSMLESLNIPFVTPPVNLKQIAARDEDARYQVAKTDAYNAFSSGDFSGLTGYSTVPNPLNPAYEISPAALEQLYAQAQAATPGVAPIESLLPPPSPYGW